MNTKPQAAHTPTPRTAAFTVRACNSHAALVNLVERAKRLVIEYGSSIEQEPYAERFAAECDAVLQRAKGRP